MDYFNNKILKLLFRFRISSILIYSLIISGLFGFVVFVYTTKFIPPMIGSFIVIGVVAICMEYKHFQYLQSQIKNTTNTEYKFILDIIKYLDTVLTEDYDSNSEKEIIKLKTYILKTDNLIDALRNKTIHLHGVDYLYIDACMLSFIEDLRPYAASNKIYKILYDNCTEIKNLCEKEESGLLAFARNLVS